MREQVYVVMDLDESDPDEIIKAVITNRREAEHLISQHPENNLAIRAFPVCSTCKEVEELIYE